MVKTTANIAGRSTEDVVKSIIEDLKWEKGIIVHKNYRLQSFETFDDPIFSDFLIVDFFIQGLTDFEDGLIISVKCQDVGGTAEQKLYYHILHVIKKCYGYPTVLVVVGDHYEGKPKTLDWIRNQIDRDKLIKVITSLDELRKWIIRFGISSGELPPQPLYSKIQGRIVGEQPRML